MITLGLTAIALAALPNLDADFIARIESTELLVNKKVIQRIEEDAKGKIVRLRLDGMRLSADEFRDLGHVTTLRSLSLRKTNVADKDIRQLHQLKHLEALNLTSTDITDDAVGEIMKLKSLRSLCLGNVAVTPKAITKLKQHFRDRKRRLSLGYFQRKKSTPSKK